MRYEVIFQLRNGNTISLTCGSNPTPEETWDLLSSLMAHPGKLFTSKPREFGVGAEGVVVKMDDVVSFSLCVEEG